jgi:hypothetical protein
MALDSPGCVEDFCPSVDAACKVAGVPFDT